VTPDTETVTARDPRGARRRAAAQRRRTIRRRRAVALGAIGALALIIALVSSSGGGTARRHDPGVRASQSASSHGAGGYFEKESGPGYLQPGSDPSVLPGPVLIADRENNRLLVVSPRGQILWTFPSPSHPLSQSFIKPDDAFFTPDGRQVIVTQEDDFVISIVDLGSDEITYRYGHPGVYGSEPNYVHNPDDALLTAGGNIVTADIKNCRLLMIRPPAHSPLRQLGTTGDCEHSLGSTYGSPNGAFPMSNGDVAVTEINGDWLDVVSPSGQGLSAINPPGFSYPSDTNEVRPGLFLSVDYTSPGTIETFNASGALRWRFEPAGSQALNHPSLALPLPNGDVLANDDQNHRVIVVDPRTNRIVWQYGHTGVAGSAPGYLNNPDGVDVAPPHSLADRFGSALEGFSG
jgi:DNA-binding beta-propeller fold protein YncE